MSVVSVKAVTSCKLGTSSGSNYEIEQLEYAGDMPVGSGPSGEMVSSDTRANVTQPVGLFQHHKHWEIIIAFSEDPYTPLYNTNVNGTVKAVVMDGENPVIGYFSITEMATDGKVRTNYWTSAAIASVTNPKVKGLYEGTDKPVWEVKLIAIGDKNWGTWA